MNHDQARELAIGLSESGTMLQRMWDNLWSMLPHSVPALAKRGKVASLYHLGSIRYVQGFQSRCEMPCQTEVVLQLKGLIQKGSCILVSTPVVETDGQQCAYSGTYEELRKKATAAQYHVRKRKKALADA